MPLLLLAAGIVVLVLLFADMLWTTMGRGAGWLTRRVSSGIWSAMRGLYGLVGMRGVLAWAGIAVMVLGFATWILLLWTGWTLVFYSPPDGVVNASTGLPAPFWERVYFTGFTIFTLGTGDFVPEGHAWRVVTAFASLSGLFLVTFSITYLVPVVQANTHLRQIAVWITALGASPQRIIYNAWRDDCTDLEPPLMDLAPELALVEQRHLTYPVLHYFHTTVRTESVAVSVAALDEALTILEFAAISRCGIGTGPYKTVRQVITEFLDTLSDAYIDPADEPPPPPSLDWLRAQGFPLASDAVFRERIEHLHDRRRLLRALVANAGWTWDQIDYYAEQRAPTETMRGA